MFNGCKSLISLPNILKWNTSNVNYMNCIFNKCKSLKSLPDISKWGMNVVDKYYIFEETKPLKSLKEKKEKNKNRIFGKEFVINNRNTCKIKYNNQEFELIEYFEDIKSYYNHDEPIEFTLTKIELITDMSHMFEECDLLIVDRICENNLKNETKSNKTFSVIENNNTLSELYNAPNSLASLSTIRKNNDSSDSSLTINKKFINYYTFYLYKSMIIIPFISKWYLSNI